LIPLTVVSNVDRRHSYETALAYQEAGALLRFVTGTFLSEGEVAWVERTGPFGRKIAKRRDRRLDRKKVVSMVGLDLIGQAAERLVGHRLRRSPLFKSYALFDQSVTRHLEGAQAIHGFEGVSARTFAYAKKRQLRTVLDAPSVHPMEWSRVLAEEVLPCLPASERRPWERRDEDVRQQKLDEIELADAIFSPSEWSMSTYRKRIAGSERLALVPYGTTIRPGEPARPEGKLRYFCLTSCLSFSKGTHLLLPAFAPLRKEAELWLAGPVLPEVRPLLAKHGESVRVFGQVGPAEAQALFDQCHVFVSASLCEGSSLAVLEAMGQGLPVIVTERCGAPVEDGVQGLIVPANQQAPLTEALLRLRDREGRLRMGALAKECAKQRTWASYRDAVRRAADPEMARLLCRR
jgi:glycosyltransferase involved in cell wall biosynthesis